MIKAEEISEIIKRQLQGYEAEIDLKEAGRVIEVGDGIARIYGLERALAGELLAFPGGVYGLVLNLEADNVGAEPHGADIVGLEVQHEPVYAAGKLEELAGEGLLESVDARDAVADLDDAPGLLEVDLGLVALELALDDLADLFRLDHVLSPRESRAHALELPVETAVHDEAADLGDESPQERLVHLLVQKNALAQDPLEPLREPALL